MLRPTAHATRYTRSPKADYFYGDKMAIVRVRKDANYFAASNEPFNDKRLSWESRGLMGYLLSKPDHWQINMEDLLKQGPAGEHKLRRMMAELRKCGYMNRIRITMPGGVFDWITEVYESPSQNPNKSASWRFSTSGSSTSGPSTCGKPPDVLSTDKASTDDIDPVAAKLQGEKFRFNPNTGFIISEWKKRHSDQRIIQAIEWSVAHRARNLNYVDQVLLGWETDGYPLSREEQKALRGNQKKKSSGGTQDLQAGLAAFVARHEQVGAD